MADGNLRRLVTVDLICRSATDDPRAVGSGGARRADRSAAFRSALAPQESFGLSPFGRGMERR